MWTVYAVAQICIYILHFYMPENEYAKESALYFSM